MKLNNNSKIITEDDIIMSDGKSVLSDILSSHQDLIQLLASNVKWIYKYGGVGGSGGGGTGPVQSFSIYASLNGILLKDQSIILDGVKLYPLSVRINNPNGVPFNVKYSYTTKSLTGNDIKLELTVVLSIENNYTFDTLISLNTNSNLQITASNGNETKLVMCSYVVTPYEFILSLIDDDGVKVPSEHFIETAALKGVNVALKYVVSIPATIQYTYSFLEDKLQGEIIDKNNTILFPINKELFKPENAGYYTASFKFDIIPEGLELVELNKSISFSLIPEDLYMLILPQEGIIYESELENPYEYVPGYLTFNYRIYEGVSLNRSYSVDIKLNGTSIILLSVIERLQYTFKLFSVTSGVNTLEVSVNRTTTYSKTYYFYIQESSLKLDWFDNPEEWVKYYYRINEVSDNFAKYKNKLYIEQTVNSSPIKISGNNPPNVSANALINTHIAIGLLYNNINSEDPVILSFYNKESGNAPVLSILQSKITRQGLVSNLYIRKQDNVNKDNVEQYHLIQIYSQYVKRIGNDFYYETSLYIDGILESVLGQVVNYPLLTDSFQIEPVNCYINLFEIDYKETEEGIPNNCDYEVYKYYLKYKNAILRLDIGDELLLTDYIKNFSVGLNGRVTINQADINNIAKNINTPVLLMTYQDDGLFDSRGGFMEALEAGYGEDGTGVGSDMNFLATLSWGSGKNSVDEILFPSGFDNAKFRISLQGSSTKMYRVKNFTLGLENSTGTELDDVYLFSPNFEEGNISTFLPETEFILKADVVDSSHSNNTSCGRFVNRVCRKFSNDIIEDGYYKDYIKNCLDGFPILVFLCHVNTDEITSETVSTYYYLGVYNFNLGRSSYYNLGYKDLSVFGTVENKLLVNAGNSFTFFKISPSLNTLKSGLGVAEILGGDPHFDFSQYDPSILFLVQESDPRYMFGDLVYGSNGTLELLKTTISKFVEKVAKSGGFLFDFLKKKRGPYETDDITEGSGYNAEVYDEEGNPTGESKNQVPDYTHQYVKYLDLSGKWLFRKKEGTIKGTQLDLLDLIVPDLDQGKLASLNYLAVSEYYTICMVLGLVDSVMKNLNIKTWNAKPDGTATWYPAFYDMDTCLGINNLGNPISYFAFSDYWHSQITKTVNNVEYPSAVRIYRDFSPHSLGENGYDVPTNYLFTVAKYAKLIFTDNTSELSIYLSLYPQELYAKWRSNVENLETNEGVLKTADKFMENFFSNNLASICHALVSYNYRSKYLKLATELDTVWVATDFNKFNGTRVNEVRDWLEGRLHILDVYFNLNRSMPQAVTYRTDNGQWETLMNGTAPVTDVMYSSNYDLAGNEDIVVLRDIFSANGGSGVQLSGHVSFQIRCPEFSPLLIYNAIGSVHENFILGGDKNQLVEFTPTGVLTVKLGGSQAWSYLLDINWITTSGLYITSDKLENITGNAGRFTSLLLDTPNVKTISLTSRNYSGNLTLDGILNYPNLSSINISGSLIALSVNNLNVKNINLANMNANTVDVSIRNCNSIETLNTSNIRLKSLSIEGLKGNLKNFSLSNTNISNITVRGGETGGTFRLTNDQSVTSVTVGDFLKVIILGCPNLNRIILTSKTLLDIEELLVIDCRADNMSITSEPTSQPGKVSISNSKIKRLSLDKTVGITNVELPSNIVLLNYAFRECVNLETVSGSNIYISMGTFYNCRKYALRDKNLVRSDLKISSSTTSLYATFYYTALTWDDVKHIINNIIPTNNSITNVSYIFAFCPIVFGLTELQNSYINNDYPNFGKLNKVTNATYMFYKLYQSGLCAVNKKFMEMGAASGCSYAHAFVTGDALRNFYVPIDIFEGTINKIVTPLFSNYNGDCHQVIFTDSTGNPLPESTEIRMSEVFNPNGLAPTKLTTLLGMEPYGDYIFDWTDTFTAAWTSLTDITAVCQNAGKKYKGYLNLLLNVPNPVRISESWNISGLEDETADYYTMYNWDKLCTLGEIFSIAPNRLENTYCNGCRKYISADNYKLLVDKIVKSRSLTSINAMFRNVVVEGALGEWDFGSTINPRITKAVLAFSGFENRTTLQSSPNFLNFSPTFCKSLPSLVNVMGMFRGCKMGRAIPFNLFNKRNLVLNSDVYVLTDSGTYERATLYTYQYRNEIYNMSHLFEGCEWQSDCLLYNPDLYDISRNKVSDGTREYSTYYTRVASGDDSYIYTEHEVVLPTEITDAENLQGGYVAKVGATPLINPTINGDYNKLIVPPDLFYGLKAQINNEELTLGVYRALACKNSLNGIIPKNLFKANKTVRCNDLWRGLVVIPQKVQSWTSGNTVTNIYVHFPSGYTKYPNLDYAFNSEYIVLEDSIIGDQTIINHSFVILEDSIPKTTSSLSHAFEGTYRWNAFGQSLNTSTHEFNFVGKINGTSVVLGLNPSYFTSLNMNQMFYSPYILAVNGNLFTMDFNAAYLKLSNRTDVVIYGRSNYGWLYELLAKTMILPKATADISLLSNINFVINSDLIVDSSTSKQYYTLAGWVVNN